MAYGPKKVFISLFHEAEFAKITFNLHIARDNGYFQKDLL
jgi:hypothetical protein